MRRSFNRTLAAVVLAAAAVIVPCTAWYVMGSEAARADADEIAKAPARHAYKFALKMSERLGSRLESRRISESQRPFYHYQQSYHDPSTSCDCASTTTSPLAHGSADPLVWTHFQIDPGFRMTLPTLAESSAGDLSQDSWYCHQQDIQAALSRSTMQCVQALELPSPFAKATAKGTTGCKEQPAPKWVSPDLPPPSALTMASEVKDFEWYTVELTERPNLVAMRKVSAESGIWIQGFVVSFEGVQALLEDASYPTAIQPAGFEPISPTAVEVTIPLEDTKWVVTVDPGGAMTSAAAKADRVMASFHRTFLGGTATAVLAALCMVWLVWQSDRMARQRSQFAASAAHELRTPLAGLRLYGEMLAEGLGDRSRQGDYANHIASEAERLGRVVSNVLGYSRLERGSLSLRPEWGDLTRPVRDSLDRLRPTLNAAGAELELSIESDLPHARFDPDAVQHIVQNLVDNAEKYTRAAPNRTIHVELAEAPGGIELTVRDHGEGIPSGTQRHLFEAFARGEDPDAPTGLGLGLVLVESLAKAQGGRVAYADAPGGGAQFTVTFPAAAAT